MSYGRLNTRPAGELGPGMGKYRLAAASRAVYGLGFVGDATTLTPAEALQNAMQGESSKDFSKQSWIAAAVDEVANGRFTITPAYTQTCGTHSTSNLNVFTTASGLALSGAATGTGIAVATGALAATTGALLGAATMGAGLVVSVIGMIFAHHTAAVKQEQALYCASIAAANNALSVMDAAVANGQTSVDAAGAGLDELVSQFSSYVAPSVGHNPCNANCEQIVILKAIVAYKKSQYAAQSAANAAALAANEAAANPASAPVPDPATVAATQTQISDLQAQAAQAQASGDTNTANSLTAQAATLQASIAPASSSIPVWAWLAAAGIAFFMVSK